MLRTPRLSRAFDTAALSMTDILPLPTFPAIVWGVGERWRRTRRRRIRPARAGPVI
jgi:hypothetical protein